MEQPLKDTDQEPKSFEEDELSLSSNLTLENVGRMRGTWGLLQEHANLLQRQTFLVLGDSNRHIVFRDLRLREDESPSLCLPLF